MRRYSHAEELVNNTPYIAMTLLGTAVLALGLEMSLWAWAAAGAYFAYGVAGAFWIMVFLCPYCAYYGTRSCPCGYGQIAARLRPKAAVECFTRKFKRHIPVIVPLWFIPPVGGGVMLVYRFSWWFLGLVIVFAVDAFVVLPLTSIKHGCKECPQRNSCPWMRSRSASPQVRVRHLPADEPAAPRTEEGPGSRMR